MVSFRVVIALVAVATLWFWLAGVLSGLGLVVSAAYFLVATLRELLWRVVTHAKGAWTPVWLLITAILGLLELFIRTKKG